MPSPGCPWPFSLPHPERSEMEKLRQTSSIPDTARATRLPVTTVAAERGRNSHRSPFTHPYSRPPSCRSSVGNWSRTSKGTGVCLDPCPGQRLTEDSSTSARLQVSCWEVLVGSAVRFEGIGPGPLDPSLQFSSLHRGRQDGGQPGRECGTRQPGERSTNMGCTKAIKLVGS